MKNICIILVATALLTGCQSRPDSWVRTPDTWAGWRKLDSSKFYKVSADKLDEAVATLKNVPFREIGLDEAQTLCQCQILITSSDKPYLVRALSLKGNTGRYFVSMRKDEVQISFGALGQSEMNQYREALIVLHDKPINQVYVSTAVSE
ncbi:hypothetical protein [Asticcacaulis endophyticus]|uniref:Lipoprotein n=1 Tax=Asticcacaulis endophyticus TaxID=1395890 RepID=A0A918QFB4_9CAUL|nr:hypothetical protein [Asticcacaulis endophyticus]GGZ45853.1 hypothetical protein GCM10011273_35580 [Asticcacaulis endophyticus]